MAEKAKEASVSKGANVSKKQSTSEAALSAVQAKAPSASKDVKASVASANQNAASEKKKSVAKESASKTQKAKVVKKVAAPKKKPVAKKKAASASMSKKQAPAKKKSTTAKPVKKAVKKTVESANTGSFKILENNTQQMEKIMSQSKSQIDKMTKQASDMGRENIEAVIKSGTIFSKGCEDMMRTAMSLAQDTAEKQTKFMKEVLGSKTLNEWTEVQSKIAQTSFDDFMSGATKMSEISVKTLTETAEPLNEQLTKSVKKASDLMAA